LFIFFTFLSNQIQHQIRTKYEQNPNNGKPENYEQKINRKSNKKYIYQGADRVVPLDIRGDCGGSEPINSERDDGGRGEIEKPLRR
jgi:hypothetical protein